MSKGVEDLDRNCCQRWETKIIRGEIDVGMISKSPRILAFDRTNLPLSEISIPAAEACGYILIDRNSLDERVALNAFWNGFVLLRQNDPISRYLPR
ncbi:hypothetical protein KW799_00860 [Candidatus Parcubacteria bacterium]|nr:hypothetical protein [Candidatus Parcubacteria bacterium]